MYRSEFTHHQFYLSFGFQELVHCNSTSNAQKESEDYFKTSNVQKESEDYFKTLKPLKPKWLLPPLVCSIIGWLGVLTFPIILEYSRFQYVDLPKPVVYAERINQTIGVPQTFLGFGTKQG